MNTISITTEVSLDTQPIRNKNSVPVYCITDGTIYASGKDAAMAENTCTSNISDVCRGKTKTCNGKLWCFVKDMPERVLDISNNTKELLEDAIKYREIDAERKAKEAHQQALNKLEEKIAKHKLDILEMQEQLAKEQQMFEAMQAEFTV